MAYIKATESTGNVPSTRGVRDVTPGMQYVNPEESPFTLLLKKSRSASATNTKISH